MLSSAQNKFNDLPLFLPYFSLKDLRLSLGWLFIQQPHLDYLLFFDRWIH